MLEAKGSPDPALISKHSCVLEAGDVWVSMRYLGLDMPESEGVLNTHTHTHTRHVCIHTWDMHE